MHGSMGGIAHSNDNIPHLASRGSWPSHDIKCIHYKSQHCSKTQSLKRQRQSLNCEIENQYCALNIKWYGANTLRKEGIGHSKKDQTKVRPNTIKTFTKTYNSVSGIWHSWWNCLGPKGLDRESSTPPVPALTASPLGQVLSMFAAEILRHPAVSCVEQAPLLWPLCNICCCSSL